QGGQPDPDLKVRTLLDRATGQVSSRFKDQPEIEAQIRVTLGRAYNGVGDAQNARANLERAAELFRATLGPNDPATLENDTLLALDMVNRGEYQKADSLLVPLFERTRRILGREHRVTLAAMNYLIRVKGLTGKPDEALSLANELVELEKRAE